LLRDSKVERFSGAHGAFAVSANDFDAKVLPLLKATSRRAIPSSPPTATQAAPPAAPPAAITTPEAARAAARAAADAILADPRNRLRSIPGGRR